MTPDDLDERLKAHYSERSLDPTSLSRLVDLAQAPRRARRWPWVLAAAAGILVTIGLTTLTLRQGSIEALSLAAAEEIALNHRKALRPEIPAATFADLGPQMTKLDFTPLTSVRIDPRQHHLLGARYCSVGSQIAAQIRLLDAIGRPLTLYQFRPGTAYAELREGTYDCDGVLVTLWREHELVFGLAAPVAPEF